MQNTATLSIRRITTTAILLALLIMGQWLFGTVIPAPLKQYVVGSWVNMTLILSLLLLPFYFALILGCVSPFVAFMLAIGTPIIELVPVIALGNAVMILAVYFVSHIRIKAFRQGQTVFSLASVLLAALLKCGFLYLTVVVLILPSLGLPAPQEKAISAAFSIIQFFTALIGGYIAYASAIPLKKALVKTRSPL